MKHSSFALFLFVALLLYSGLSYYMFRRTGQALAGLGPIRTAVLSVFLFMAVSYPLGRFAERISHNWVTDALVLCGSFYLGSGVYVFFLTALADLARLGNRIFHYFPSSIANNPGPAARIAWLAGAALVLAATAVGYYIAMRPQLKTYDLTIHKRAGSLSELNIVAVSDIHLGTAIGNGQLRRIARVIRSADPDLVILAGDVFDEDVSEKVERNTVRVLKDVKTRFGVFAITGNHEYYGGVEKAVGYLQQAGVVVLQDSVVKIAGAVYVAGRKDKTAERMGTGRMTLDELLADVDRAGPIVLLDHQPFHLELPDRYGVDVQISGHTHHGQLFPFQYITSRVYELSWGCTRKGNTHVVVSCGAGTWGAPMRTNSVCEVLRVRLRFDG